LDVSPADGYEVEPRIRRARVALRLAVYVPLAAAAALIFAFRSSAEPQFRVHEGLTEQGERITLTVDDHGTPTGFDVHYNVRCNFLWDERHTITGNGAVKWTGDGDERVGVQRTTMDRGMLTGERILTIRISRDGDRYHGTVAAEMRWFEDRTPADRCTLPETAFRTTDG
jgi:hypothetical protein